jgi:hypothetical protein
MGANARREARSRARVNAEDDVRTLRGGIYASERERALLFAGMQSAAQFSGSELCRLNAGGMSGNEPKVGACKKYFLGDYLSESFACRRGDLIGAFLALSAASSQ